VSIGGCKVKIWWAGNSVGFLVAAGVAPRESGEKP